MTSNVDRQIKEIRWLKEALRENKPHLHLLDSVLANRDNLSCFSAVELVGYGTYAVERFMNAGFDRDEMIRSCEWIISNTQTNAFTPDHRYTARQTLYKYGSQNGSTGS